MRGLAAASCQQPSNDFYIVGGSTAAGREALLVLSNPSPIDATADLKIYTDLGEVKVSGLAGISVPARTTTVISLASFAPTVPGLAVFVQSQGAKLAGWIQQRAVRGTAAQGVDWISPNPRASEQLVIPGLVIRGTGAIKQVSRSEENSDAGHALRVFAPEGANVTVQITSSEQDVFGAVFTGIVEPGSVQDFPIDELLDGDYSVFISSDKPVYAGLRVARGNPRQTPRVDFAWLSPAEELTSDRAISIPDAGDSILVLANSGSEKSIARVQNLVTGESVNVSIPAQGTSTVSLSGPAQIFASAGVFAKAVILLEGQISDIDVAVSVGPVAISQNVHVALPGVVPLRAGIPPDGAFANATRLCSGNGSPPPCELPGARTRSRKRIATDCSKPNGISLICRLRQCEVC
jgi:hypothetical protein